MIKELVGVVRADRCHYCKIWFTYDMEDTKESHDRDGVYLEVNCPECNATVTVGVK